jgi:hypothetical protein
VRRQRFIGVLEVTDKYFIDEKPIFANENDPFVLRFKVKPLVFLSQKILIEAILNKKDMLLSTIYFPDLVGIPFEV